MSWIAKMLFDFFAGVGFIVVAGLVVVVIFYDGQVNNVSTAWIFIPACIFAWLRGEFIHWPGEHTRNETD